MAEYINKEDAIDIVSRMEKDNDGSVSDEYYKGYCAGIELAVAGIEDILPDLVAPVNHAKWRLVPVYVGGGWQAEAHCTNCGWEWESLKDGVGNPKAVYRALFTNGSDEFQRNFVMDNAREQKLYGWCPRCGAKMSMEDE